MSEFSAGMPGNYRVGIINDLLEFRLFPENYFSFPCCLVVEPYSFPSPVIGYIRDIFTSRTDFYLLVDLFFF
jgi:hypothetical protein